MYLNITIYILLLRDYYNELNINKFLKEGDVTQNPSLREGDCLYLTSNHKLSFAEIFTLITRSIAAWDDLDEIRRR